MMMMMSIEIVAQVSRPALAASDLLEHFASGAQLML
jgi:hypothetical protein